MANQNPEQRARDRIDQLLIQAGWLVRDKKTIDFTAGPGLAVREYQTDAGPADYVLFVASSSPPPRLPVTQARMLPRADMSASAPKGYTLLQQLNQL